MFKLGVITDEVSQSLDTAIEFCKTYRLNGVELRSVEGKGPFEWTAQDVCRWAAQLKAAGLAVAAISAPLFKCDIHDEAAVQSHLEGFARCAGFAKMLGCEYIRGFDFWACGAAVEKRAAMYAPVIDICRQAGVTCVLEYDPSVHSSTPPLLREMVDAIGSPCVKAVFDAGNGVFTRPDVAPTPGDYDALRSVLRHIHVKDAVPTPQGVQAVKVGSGRVNWPALLALLARDGYTGWLVLETHYRLGSTLTEAQLALPGGADFSSGAYSASAESIQALHGMIAALENRNINHTEVQYG